MAITTENFNKIFASNASAEEVNDWGESRYEQGWGYLGTSTPPPMELFNKFFQDTDLKAQYLYNKALAIDSAIAQQRTDLLNEIAKYVKKGGDTMSGGITFSTSTAIKRNADTNELYLCGGSGTSNGGNIQLYGKDHTTIDNQGAVKIVANKGTQNSVIAIFPNGTTSAPTPTITDNSTKIATTAYVKSNLAKYLPLSGGSITGNVTINGNLTATKVYNAVYNDYAEFFPRGEQTEAGDLVALDLSSDKELYVKATKDSIVVGIHSDEYAHIIGGEDCENYEEENTKKYIPVALTGRVSAKIKGVAKKGMYLIPSNEAGIGEASYNKKNSVGIIVEDDNRTDLRRIKVFVKVG